MILTAQMSTAIHVCSLHVTQDKSKHLKAMYGVPDPNKDDDGYQTLYKTAKLFGHLNTTTIIDKMSSPATWIIARSLAQAFRDISEPQSQTPHSITLEEWQLIRDLARVMPGHGTNHMPQ